MLLDTSDKAWDMFLEIVRKAKQANTVWYSPDKGHSYELGQVAKNVEIVVHKGENQTFSKLAYTNFLKKISSSGGRLARAHSGMTVARETCIVTFHPQLKLSDDTKGILVIETFTIGSIDYPGFGSPPRNDDPNELQTFARKVRHGQPLFRKALLKAYEGRCCVTGCEVEEALDACHIIPHAVSGINDLKNGLLLRADIHNLLDANLLFIEPASYRIHLAPSLRSSHYKELHGQYLRSRLKPGDSYLRDRYKDKKW